LVQFLVGNNTFDNKLYNIINRKLNVLGKSIDGINDNQLEINKEIEIDKDQDVSQFFKSYFQDFHFDSALQDPFHLQCSQNVNIDETSQKGKNDFDSNFSPGFNQSLSIDEIDSILDKHDNE
jgi:methionyl-tRNA synthetase